MNRLLRVNEHLIDRGIRVVIGAGLLAVTVIGPKTWWGVARFRPFADGDWWHVPAVRDAWDLNVETEG